MENEIYRVTLGHRVIPIFETDTLVEEEAIGMFTSGDDGEMKIQVGRDLSPKLKASTIFHELLHCIEHVYGIELEERGVLMLEATLGDFLHANAEFVGELIEQFLGTFTVSSIDLSDPSLTGKAVSLEEAIKISRQGPPKTPRDRPMPSRLPHEYGHSKMEPGYADRPPVVDAKIEEKVKLSGKFNTGYNNE